MAMENTAVYGGLGKFSRLQGDRQPQTGGEAADSIFNYGGLRLVHYGGQSQRSKAERELPSYVLEILDAARSGYDYLTGRKLTVEEANDIIAAYTTRINPNAI
jgi:hypothetical protein